jgi:hypothetical protein
MRVPARPGAAASLSHARTQAPQHAPQLDVEGALGGAQPEVRVALSVARRLHHHLGRAQTRQRGGDQPAVRRLLHGGGRRSGVRGAQRRVRRKQRVNQQRHEVHGA